jgi:hypothetical protein
MFPAVHAVFSTAQLILFFTVTMVRKKPMSAHGMTSGTEKGTEVCEHVIIMTRMLNAIV